MITAIFDLAKKNKSIAAFILLLLVFFQIFLPLNVYADDSSDMLDSYYEQALAACDQQRARDTQESDDEAIEISRAIVTYMKDTADMSKDPTVEGGYNIIDAAIKEAEGDSNLAPYWKKKFKEKAQSLGVEFSSIITTVTDGTYTTTIEGDAEADWKDSAIKINILTWNNNKVDGNTVASFESGAIQELLNQFDSNDTFLQKFTKPIAGVAVALIVTFGAISLINLSMERSVTNEAVIREFTKIIIGVWIVYNYRVIAYSIIAFGSWILQNLQSSLGGRDSQAASMEYALITSFIETIQEHNPITEISSDMFAGIANAFSDLWDKAGEFFSSITSLFGNGIVQLASSLAVYSVAIEIGVRYALTPIAIADLYSEKFRSNGIVWLKKLLACALTGVVIFLVIFTTDAFKNVVGASFSLITNTAINLTMIGMLFRARQIANDIVGTH